MKMSYRPHAFDNQCIAEITINRNSIKKYKNDYYLRDKQEFEILLRNNTQNVVMAVISLNGSKISESGLVLNPGQRVYLERYLDTNRKFLFKVYDVEDGNLDIKRAIENNGDVEIKFYREKQISKIWQENIPYYRQPHDIYNQQDLTNKSVSFNSLFNTGNPNYTTEYTLTTTSSLSPVKKEKLIETGRVDKGNISNQEFTNYNGDFEQYSFKTIKFKILPHSLKPTEVSDLAVYCTNCGTKNRKGTYQYCPKCGTKY